MKRRIVGTIALAASLLCSAAESRASVVYATAPADRTYPALQTLTCTWLNSGTAGIIVKTDVLDSNGNVTTAGGAAVVAPGMAASLQDGGAGAYCRFTLIAGNKKAFHAQALYDDGFGYRIAIPAN